MTPCCVVFGAETHVYRTWADEFLHKLSLLQQEFVAIRNGQSFNPAYSNPTHRPLLPKLSTKSLTPACLLVCAVAADLVN